MSGIQTTNGKAFEYACLKALYNVLSRDQEVIIENSRQMNTAKDSFTSLSADSISELMRAAYAATRVIIRLEPQLDYSQDDVPLYLSLQQDAKGIAGDVRDTLCVRG